MSLAALDSTDIWLSDEELTVATPEERELYERYLRRRLHAVDPVSWGTQILSEHWWSMQREIAYAVRDHRKVAVRSCHEAGKDFIAARIACWWIATHSPGRASVVTTATTGDQVKAILWKEINQAHKKGHLIGHTNLTEWYIDGELVGIGRKVADYNPTAMQGIHAPEGVLVIYDEACHDEQTEVLTERGWQLFKELDGTERLLSMDPATHEASYQRPTRLVSRRHEGPMYLYEAMGANYCVTPDHEMLWHGRSHGHATHWRKAPMTSLADANNKFMRKTIEWNVPDVGHHVIPEFRTARKTWPALRLPMDKWLELLGWYCSEGSLIKGRGVPTGFAIGQKDDDVRRHIYDLAIELGLPAKLYECGIQIHVHSRQLGEHLAELGENCLVKRVPEYARQVSARQLGIFLDAFVAGDGYRKGNGEIIYTSSPGMADDLQEMALKTGVPSVVRRRPLKGLAIDFGTHMAMSSCDGYVITRPGRSSKIKHSPHNGRWIDYAGMVYCATVPSGLLFTRRNGYTLWSGNCGIPEDLFQAGNSMAGNDASRQLAIGNPDDPQSYFAKLFRPGSDWHQIHIDGYATPNFTDEEVPEEIKTSLLQHAYVDGLRREYGEESPIFVSKVRGNFPDDAKDGVVPWSKLMQCRYVLPLEMGPHDLGVDVAASEEGDGDATIIRERSGNTAGREWELHSAESEVIVGAIVQAIQETGARRVKIDSIGVGFGVCGHLRALGKEGVHDAKVIAVNVAERSSNPARFPNLRSQIWWEVAREATLREEWSLGTAGDKTLVDLVGPRYSINARGQNVVEPKAETKKRTGRSPDHADALNLAFYEPLGIGRGHTYGRQIAEARLS